MLNAKIVGLSCLLIGFIFNPGKISAVEMDVKNASPGEELKLGPAPREAHPHLFPASDEAELAIKRIRVPENFRTAVFAAEPMLANPVAFCLDEQGRVFVSETYRFNTSVLDIRRYMAMLDDDLACRTVEDRLHMTERRFGQQAKDLARESEVIRLLEDRNHDGKADFSAVYADGFNSMLDGIASGVLARHGKVWFANIPEISELEGIDKKGHAKSRKTFSYGYGVRFSYTGHDLHGLILGPDGKLYFSFGDRGASVKTKEGKTLAYPDEGAVFRCNQDGSEMEVVHHGLRNPQELAFDEFGNLFTGDNDFDHGDHERWVYVVEGGDSGWRVGYQHPPLGYNHVPWMADQLWTPYFEGQAAYIIPPVANIGDGPSGLTYYPGTGLPEKYNGHFFLCQFKGSTAQSGIETFAVKPKGASFELVDSEPFIWNVEATDVDFGPDSQLYFSDWGEGWERNRKGRIYRVFETNSVHAPIVDEAKKLLAKGFDRMSQKELLKLLSHANMRVRLEAQYALAERGNKSVEALAKIAAETQSNPRARRHAIWALGQIGRKNPAALSPLLPLLRDGDAEIRAQSAKILGEGRANNSFAGLAALLGDSNLRVRFFAAQSLGKLGRSEAVQPLVTMLRENNNQDLYLRHAGVVALSRCASPDQLLANGKDNSAAVRMAALLAMRRLERPEIAEFLNDADDLLVVEAARAINDVPINAAMPKLAALIGDQRTFSAKFTNQFEALQLRVINANFRLGQSENALALASYAARENSPGAVAVEALTDLSNWAEPGRRDRIVGVFRPYDSGREKQAAVTALLPIINKIIAGSGTDKVKLAAIAAINQLQLAGSGEALFQVFSDGKNPERVRVEALKTLGQLKSAGLNAAVKLAQTDSSELIRKEGNRLATEMRPDTALAQIRSILESGSIPEKQGALNSLGAVPGPEADRALAELLEQLSAGKLAREVELELLDAVAKHPSPVLKSKLAQYDAKGSGALKNFQQALFGGNAEAGRKIFFEKAEASCVRCHKIKDEGGDVGPALSGVGTRQAREYLLESLVQPNAKIAPGFETLLVIMKNGSSYAGVFKSENESELVINSPEDGITKIVKADIKTRSRGNSGMPDGLGEALSKRDLRDLVEFLSSLK